MVSSGILRSVKLGRKKVALSKVCDVSDGWISSLGEKKCSVTEEKCLIANNSVVCGSRPYCVGPVLAIFCFAGNLISEACEQSKIGACLDQNIDYGVE